MLYNIYVFFNRSNNYVIYGVSDEMLISFVDAFEKGKKSFFYQGENFKLNEEIKKVVIFDLSKIHGEINSRIIGEIKTTIHKKLAFYLDSFETASTDFGVNVTSKYINNPYGSNISKSDESPHVKIDEYVNISRIEELKTCTKNKFDLTKPIRLCEEINIAYQHHLFFATGTLVRAILDHIPPIFDLLNFSMVANNYKAKGKEQSFKASMEQLNKSMRKISDTILHSQITNSETLPNSTQVDCKRDLDRLLEEIVRILKR